MADSREAFGAENPLRTIIRACTSASGGFRILGGGAELASWLEPALACGLGGSDDLPGADWE